MVRASGDGVDSSGDSEHARDGTPVEVEGNRSDLERKLGSLREMVNALPPPILVVRFRLINV